MVMDGGAVGGGVAGGGAEAYLPRRALPIRSSARPPAPMVFAPLTEERSVAEDKQELVLGHDPSLKAPRVPRGVRTRFQAHVARAVVNSLTSEAKSRPRLIDHRFQYGAYALAFAWYMVCLYMCVLYGLKFTPDIERAWLIAFFVSLFQDIFINETLLIGALASFRLTLMPRVLGFLAGHFVARSR